MPSANCFATGKKIKAYLRWWWTICLLSPHPPLIRQAPAVSIIKKKKSNLQKVQKPPSGICADAYRNSPPHTLADYGMPLVLDITLKNENFEVHVCVCLPFLKWWCRWASERVFGKKMEKMRWFSPHLYFKVNKPSGKINLLFKDVFPSKSILRSLTGFTVES